MPTEVRLNTKRDRYPADGTSRYWETEEPTVAQAGNVELRCYATARKFQFVQTIQNRDGSTRAGKVVAVDLDALAASSDAMSLLRSVLNATATTT